MSARRIAVLAVSAATLGIATPAALAATWSAGGSGKAAARAATLGAPTLTGITRTNCSGSSHILTITFATPSGTPTGVVVYAYRGASAGNETLTSPVASASATATAMTDSNANSNGNQSNYYVLKSGYGGTWRSASSNEAFTSNC